MKKVFFALGLLLGCASSDEMINTQNQGGAGSGGSGSLSEPEANLQSGSSFKFCQNAYEIKEFQFENRIYLIKVPILCDENAKDSPDENPNMDILPFEIDIQNY